MYFNENKENTNIDSEFNTKKGFDLAAYKLPLIIIGAILLLIIIILIALALGKKKTNYFIVLEGEENITIYQGATYNEPGYSAMDNRNNDYTSSVTVKSNLDAEAVGSYEIIYSLNNASVKRHINVIERPEVTTVIHLTGEKNMTIKKDAEYKEPGYSAIDALDGDITDKVTTTGTVKTAEAGTYRIVYSVVNSKGVTTSEVRIVVVE